MLQVKRSQRTFSESKNPDLRVARREHMVIPILVHTAAAACELESKVLPRKKNVIGPKIDSKAGKICWLCIENRELPFLVDLGNSIYRVT